MFSICVLFLSDIHVFTYCILNSKCKFFKNNLDECIVKPKLRKVERKFVPVVEKLSVEELMETNTYQKFNKCIEKVFESTEEIDTILDFGNYSY